MGHPRATLTEAAEAHAVSGRSLPLCGWASLERVGGATNSFFLVCVESPWRVLDRGARTLEITTLTVIWARQLVSPQPKLGPVP